VNPAARNMKFSLSSLGALCLAAAAAVMSAAGASGALLTAILLTALTAFWSLPIRRGGWRAGVVCSVVLIAGAWAVLQRVHQQTTAETGVWVFVAALSFLAWRTMELLSAVSASPKEGKAPQLLLDLSVPLLFGAWLFFLWESLTTGLAVPQVLLPAPSLIGGVLMNAAATLAADFHQTFIRAVVPGFLVGCTCGFITAVASDRVPFLRRGLLPLGNLVSAIPIVGIAPIMVMWFGFDWQSKAAVVAVMTFFPMLVNTLAGLADAGRTELDLLHTYAADYWRELLSLRLPGAMPFILNALKVNSTLAMIGAIVAEFFGTPIVGMGFRISTEVGRMNIDMVWATIAVAALAGSLFYGLFAMLERTLTFWHPSMQKRSQGDF